MTTTCRIVVPSVRVLSYFQHISNIDPRHAHLAAKHEYRFICYFIRSWMSITIARLYNSFSQTRLFLSAHSPRTREYTRLYSLHGHRTIKRWKRIDASRILKTASMVANNGARGCELVHLGATWRVDVAGATTSAIIDYGVP